jgi:hypothetical protein
MRHYETALASAGLTPQQYGRSVCAHELAHGLVAATLTTTDTRAIRVADHPQLGAVGDTHITASTRQPIDPMDAAVYILVGAIAQEMWLRETERAWSPRAAGLVRRYARQDERHLHQLPLNTRQLDAARETAGQHVRRLWDAIAQGVPQLAALGDLDQRRIRALLGTNNRGRAQRAALTGTPR